MWLCSYDLLIFSTETFSITSQNDSERLRKGNLQRNLNASTRRCQNTNQDGRYLGVHPCLSYISRTHL